MGNNKQLAKNMIYNIISFGINFGISFFFTPYLIKVIGKEAYGFFPLANNFIGYTSIITTAIGSMAGRFITIKIYNGETEKAKIYFNSTLVAYSVLSLFFTVIAIFLVIFINKILNIPSYLLHDVQWLFLLTFLCTIISLPFSILGIGTFVKNRIDMNASRRVITNILRVVSVVLLFWMFKPNIVYVGISALLATLLGVWYNIRFKYKLLPEINIAPKKYFSWAAVKELISSGIWNSVNQLSVILLTQLDLLITNIFISASAAGDYALAKTVPSLIQSIVGVLVGVFVPQFTILYAQKNKNNLLHEINKSIKMMGLFVTLPISFLLIYGKDFFDLWVPGQDSGSLYWLSNLTIIPMIVTGSINTIFNVYTVTNKLKIPAVVLLVTGVINTIIVLVLLKTTNLGIWAIPLTSLIIGLLRNLIFTPIYAAHCLNLRSGVFYNSIYKGSLCALSTLIISYVINIIYAPNNWIVFIFSAVIISIISMTMNSFIVLTKSERLYLINKFKQYV